MPARNQASKIYRQWAASPEDCRHSIVLAWLRILGSPSLAISPFVIALDWFVGRGAARQTGLYFGQLPTVTLKAPSGRRSKSILTSRKRRMTSADVRVCLVGRTVVKTPPPATAMGSSNWSAK